MKPVEGAIRPVTIGCERRLCCQTGSGSGIPLLSVPQLDARVVLARRVDLVLEGQSEGYPLSAETDYTLLQRSLHLRGCGRGDPLGPHLLVSLEKDQGSRALVDTSPTPPSH